MASFTGKLQDFYDIVLPKIRKNIASMTKKKKIELGYICQHCHQKNELDSAHKHGRSLKDIVKNVLEYYKIENGEYFVPDLHQLILKIIGEHIPIENNFWFLCKKCHIKYDSTSSVNNEIDIDSRINEKDNSLTERIKENMESDYEQVFLQLISSNSNLKDCLKKLFVKFPDTIITSTHLRKIWEKQFPNENSKKVTDYLWHLEKEGVLIKTSRSNYKSSNEIQSNVEHQSKSVKKVSKIRNIINQFSKKTKSKNTVNQKIIPHKGEEFTEKELYTQFRVRNSGGIRPSVKNKVVVLINSYFSEKQGGYENETNEKSGFVYHVGEGEGNQEMKRNNKSIYESKQNGYAILYFDKPEPNKIIYRFQAEYDSWKSDRQKNAHGTPRNVILFKLKIIN